MKRVRKLQIKRCQEHVYQVLLDDGWIGSFYRKRNAVELMADVMEMNGDDKIMLIGLTKSE